MKPDDIFEGNFYLDAGINGEILNYWTANQKSNIMFAWISEDDIKTSVRSKSGVYTDIAPLPRFSCNSPHLTNIERKRLVGIVVSTINNRILAAFTELYYASGTFIFIIWIFLFNPHNVNMCPNNRNSGPLLEGLLREEEVLVRGQM